MGADGDSGRKSLLATLFGFLFNKSKKNVKIIKATTTANLTAMIKTRQEVKPSKGRQPMEMTVSGLPKFYNPTTGRAEYVADAKGQGDTNFDVRLNPGVVPTNSRQNANDTFRSTDEYTDDLVWARSGWPSDEARVGVQVAIRNVLGNANLFESEMAELAYSISCVTKTANMKEFVRALGLSHAYRSRFFEPMNNMRFVELNFLHFLGRAPESQAEIAEHIRIINEEGYNAEINSYVDSDEYDTLFGDSRIPAPNFRGGYPNNVDLNKLAVLNGGFAKSDNTLTSAMMPSADSTQFAPYSITKGMPEAWVGENKARNESGPIFKFRNAFWMPVPTQVRDAEISYKARYGVLRKFWYTSSQIGKELMQPQLSHTDDEKADAEAVLKYGTTMAKLISTDRGGSDHAPMIEVNPPKSGPDDGRLGLRMAKPPSFPIPYNLKQNA